MTGALDLLLLAAVSVCFSTRHLYLGMVIFSLGLVFLFQARRSRLLTGWTPKPQPVGRRVRAAAGAVLLAAGAAPLLTDAGPAATIENAEDLLFPAVVLVVLLCGMLVLGLGVERRKR